MQDNYDPNWFDHLKDLEGHYNPDKFFSNELNKPNNRHSVKNHFHAPAFVEEAEIPEEAQLSIDIHQDQNNLYVTCPIAGADPATLDLNLDKDILTIKGQRSSEFTAESQDQYIYQECYWGKFSRSIILPLPVKPEKVEATLKNNVLLITLPKAQEDKSIRIKVKEN